MENSRIHANFIDQNWYQTAEGTSCVQQLFVHTGRERKQFGLLERPSLAPGILELDYKIALLGKSGAGKTRLVSTLSGQHFSTSTTETVGIHVKDVYWPAKLGEKIVLFKLQFWDHGENLGRKYSYIVPGCIEKADVIAFVVNTNDKMTLDYCAQHADALQAEGTRKTIIGIASNLQPELPVEIYKEDFEQMSTRLKIPFCYVPVSSPSNGNSLKFLVPCFTQLCNLLYSRSNLSSV